MGKYIFPEKYGSFDMPEEEYFALEAASNSGLRELARSPAHYRHMKDTPNEPTAAMKEGTAIHRIVLEPAQFNKLYALKPDNAPNRPTDRQRNAKKPSDATLDAIQFWDQFDIMNEGKEILTLDNWNKLHEVAAAVKNHPICSKLLNQGVAEQSVIAKDPETGCWVKTRPDFQTIFNGHNIMIDLKTSKDVRDFSFQRTAWTLGYFTAAALYMDVAEWAGNKRPDMFAILAVERDAPYGIRVFSIPEQYILLGRDVYRERLNLYAECLEKDEWPGYETDIQELAPPAWASQENS